MTQNYVIVRDKFYIAKEEIKALERLLMEARQRQRELFKKNDRQGWWDWFWEIVGLKGWGSETLGSGTKGGNSCAGA